MVPKKGIGWSILVVVCVLVSLVGVPTATLARPSQQANAPAGCWRVVPTPAIGGQSSEIRAISASAPNNIWAVGNSTNSGNGSGYSGFILRWDGAAWSQVVAPVLTRTYSLNDIKVLSPNDVWVVGSAEPANPSPNPVAEASPDLFAIHWDGSKWSVSLYEEGGGYPASIDATSDNDVWVVGNTPITQVGGEPVILHKVGNTWNDLSPTEETISFPYSKVLAISPDDVWIAGDNLLHWDGRALSQPIPVPNSGGGLGMATTSSNNVWLVGNSATSYVDRFDGQNWTPTSPVSPGRFTYLQTIASASVNDAWVGGSYAESSDFNGLLEHWDGTGWTAIPNPVPGFSSAIDNIEAVGGEYWAVGMRLVDSSGQGTGFILHYTSQPCSASAPQKPLNPPAPLPGVGSQRFITGNSITGLFLDYWNQHGGLAQQGYPISGVLGEQSDLNGNIYTVQYFERAVFEYHPENKGTPYEVLLAQLGTFRYHQKYPNGAPNQRANHDPGTVLFQQTGKHLGGTFLKYWQEHGGLQQQGYPISEEFTEVSDLDGLPYTVQYFERAVFEWHPENSPPYNVLLSQLGHFRYDDKYGTQQTQTTIPRRIADSIIPSTLHGAGNRLVWADMRNACAVCQTIYTYDAAQNRQQPISEVLTAPDGLPLATNGTMAFWTRRDIDRRYLEGYNFQTGAEARLFQPDTVSSPDFRRSDIALDQTTLYYTDNWEGHTGIFAQDIATGNERQIYDKVPAVGSLVAGDGVLLWTEAQQTGANTSRALRMYRANTGGVTTLASGIGGFTGYSVSGNNVVYSFFNNITTQTTYLYSIDTGARKVIELGAASNPVIQGKEVAWVLWPSTDSGESDGWKVQTYNMDTGAVKTVASGLRAMPKNLALLADGKIAFAADNDLTLPGSELYILDLDTGQ